MKPLVQKQMPAHSPLGSCNAQGIVSVTEKLSQSVPTVPSASCLPLPPQQGGLACQVLFFLCQCAMKVFLFLWSLAVSSAISPCGLVDLRPFSRPPGIAVVLNLTDECVVMLKHLKSVAFSCWVMRVKRHMLYQNNGQYPLIDSIKVFFLLGFIQA